MSDPLISIIIPTYNRAHLIAETLDSILAQTYENWECIIIDDGSTDNTDQIVKAYANKDKRFQYHLRPETHKPGGNGARNYGFELSKGEYVNWFDSDDLMHSQKLQTQLELILKYSNKDFVLCQTAFFENSASQIVSLWNSNLYSENPIDDFIVKNIGWSILSPFWKKSSLLMNNVKFDENLSSGQDFKFHIQILFNNLKPIICDEILVFARIHTNQIKSSTNKAFSKMLVFKFLYFHRKQFNKNTLVFVVDNFVIIIRKLYIEKKSLNALALSYFVLKNEFSLHLFLKIIKLTFFGNIYYLFGRGYSFLSVKTT